MKKLKIFLIILALFVVISFLQINFFTWFNIAGVMPNLFVVLVLFIGLFAGKKLGAISGLIFGLIADFMIGKTIGFSAVFLAIIGLLGEYFDKNFSKNNKLMIIIMSVAATVFYETLMYAVNVISFKLEPEILPFLRILLIENIYNVLLIVAVYPGMKKLGYYLESQLNDKQLLTRYF